MAARKKARSRPRKPAKARAARHPKKAARAVRRPKKAARAGAGKKPARRAAARPATPARIPSGIGFLSQHIDYTTHDLEGVRRFYTELLGFTRFSVMPEHNYLAIHTGPGSSLGFMPPMPGPPEQWRPPREPTLYLFVDNVDRAHAALVARGVTFEQAPQDMPWGHRVAIVRDPEGRTVCLAQPLAR